MTEARRVLDDLRERARTAPVQHSALAQAHAALGDVDEALTCVEQMVAAREGLTVGLAAFRWWDPLRGNVRFETVVDGLRFPGPAREFPTTRRAANAQRGPAKSA